MVCNKFNPNDINILDALTKTYSHHGNFSEAEVFFKRLIELLPSDPKHLKNKALFLIEKGDVEIGIPKLISFYRKHPFLGITNLKCI